MVGKCLLKWMRLLLPGPAILRANVRTALYEGDIHCCDMDIILSGVCK